MHVATLLQPVPTTSCITKEITSKLWKSCFLSKLKVAGTECRAVLLSKYSIIGQGKG